MQYLPSFKITFKTFKCHYLRILRSDKMNEEKSSVAVSEL